MCVCICVDTQMGRGEEGRTCQFLSLFLNASPQMGGAMAPPMKDLPRWLEENPEFAVAPDWTDIVKQSVSINSASLSRKVSVQNCFPEFFFIFCWSLLIQ